jgi:hypothetical protein
MISNARRQFNLMMKTPINGLPHPEHICRFKMKGGSFSFLCLLSRRHVDLIFLTSYTLKGSQQTPSAAPVICCPLVQW